MPFISVCPFCAKGKVRCPDHAIGWSVTCPNTECGSSFTITRPEKSTATVTGSSARMKVGSSSLTSSPVVAIADADGMAQPRPISVPQAPSPERMPTTLDEDPRTRSPWLGTTVFSMLLGSAALLGLAIVEQTFDVPISTKLIFVGLAALGVFFGLIGVSTAKQRRLGEMRAWVGPFAGGMGLVLFALPYLTGAQWRATAEASAPDLRQRLAIPAKPQSGLSQNLQETDWIDASKDVVQMGDVWLRITSMAVEPVALKVNGRPTTSDDAFLVIRVQISNTGTSRKLDYQSWADGPSGPSRHAPTLKDSAGRVYKQRTFAQAAVAGQALNGFIFPRKALDDAIVFYPPTGRFEYLRLELPLSAVGGEGQVRLQVPKSMVKFR